MKDDLKSATFIQFYTNNCSWIRYVESSHSSPFLICIGKTKSTLEAPYLKVIAKNFPQKCFLYMENIFEPHKLLNPSHKQSSKQSCYYLSHLCVQCLVHVHKLMTHAHLNWFSFVHKTTGKTIHMFDFDELLIYELQTLIL